MRQTYLNCTMSVWGKLKPTNSPETVWGNPGWGDFDPEWRIKVPGNPAILNRHHPPTLEVSTCPTKRSHSSKNFTHLDTLPLETLHTIDMWRFIILHHDKFKKVLAQITQNNPPLCSTRSYKLKCAQFEDPMNYKDIYYMCT